jgi:hypothetical protein
MIWVFNPVSGSPEFLPIPDPGSKGQTRLRIPDPDLQHCFKASLPLLDADQPSQESSPYLTISREFSSN